MFLIGTSEFIDRVKK